MSNVNLGTLSSLAVMLRNKSLSVKTLMGEQVKSLLEGYDSQRGLHEVLKVINESESATQHFAPCPSAKLVIDEILGQMIDVWSKKSFMEYFSDRGVRDECVLNSVNALNQVVDSNATKIDAIAWLAFAESELNSGCDVLRKVMYDPLAEGVDGLIDDFIHHLPDIGETNFQKSLFVYLVTFYVIQKVSRELEELSILLSNEQCVGRKGVSERLKKGHDDYIALFNNSRNHSSRYMDSGFIDDYYLWYFFSVHYNYDLHWTERGDSYFESGEYESESVESGVEDGADWAGATAAALVAEASHTSTKGGVQFVERDESSSQEMSDSSMAAESAVAGAASSSISQGESNSNNLGSFS